VIIDTEEEFDWSRPLSRENTATDSIVAQSLAQEIFAKYDVTPTYVIDYPVATSETAVAVLKPLLEAGRCELGAHLHPWVNPPHDEEVTPYNSYPGNLPEAAERGKLERLIEAIARNFGQRPTVYKAGRYGVGPRTARILEDLGFEVDLSVVPRTSFAADGGPDFTAFDHRPYWFGERQRLLEIPLSVGFAGRLARLGPWAYPLTTMPWAMRLRAPGIAARLRLLERIRLTPEGIDHPAHRRLTKHLLSEGCRVFSLTYHSPSLQPGRTPYVGNEAELGAFLKSIDDYLDFFLNGLGGEAATPASLYRRLKGG
jgi:peptidoglycan/xylan/chitin deacetylase (PgdA/CDA1 family)